MDKKKTKSERFGRTHCAPSVLYCGMCLLLCCISRSGHADTAVAPNDRASQSGNTFVNDGFNGAGKFQIVFGSQNFSRAPILVTGVAFRLDEGSAGSFDAIIPNITIQLSTYRGTFASFNPSSYEANMGFDNRTVYDGSVHWASTDRPGSTPNPFDFRVTLQQPFMYDSSQGPLLMSFTNPGGGIGPVDAQNHGVQSIGWEGFGGSFGQPGITVLQNVVTEFEYVTVPEPQMASLLAFGILVTRLVANKR